MGDPVTGDVDSATDPDPVVALDVVKEALERADAAGPANEAQVQSDRHLSDSLSPCRMDRSLPSS